MPYPPPGLAAHSAGSIAVETAIVAPVLLLMSLGGFQVSMMIARQNELQSAAAEAAAIVMAAQPDTQAKVDTIENVIATSAGLDADQVTITRLVRCGTAPSYVADGSLCSNGVEVSTFLRIAMTDTYTPAWTQVGVGGPLTYRVTRTVQLS